MGYALAETARTLGAEVTLISGPTSLTPPRDINFISITTTQELHDAVNAAFDSCHCLIMAAAPADFTPSRKAAQKIKKSGQGLELELIPTVDILREVAQRKRTEQIVVGFALETENGESNASKKLKEKNLDLIVLNSPIDPDSAFGSDNNKVTIIRPNRKPEPWPHQSKQEVALNLLELIHKLR